MRQTTENTLNREWEESLMVVDYNGITTLWDTSRIHAAGLRCLWDDGTDTQRMSHTQAKQRGEDHKDFCSAVSRKERCSIESSSTGFDLCHSDLYLLTVYIHSWRSIWNPWVFILLRWGIFPVGFSQKCCNGSLPLQFNGIMTTLWSINLVVIFMLS